MSQFPVCRLNDPRQALVPRQSQGGLIVSFSANAASRPFLRVPRNALLHLNGLCRLGGLGDDSRGPTEAVEVRGYSLGARSNGLYVVEADLTTFHRLANLRGGMIELQVNLQLLEPIYLCDQPGPYFFNGSVESVQFGGL
jgi:hypothetical protein